MEGYLSLGSQGRISGGGDTVKCLKGGAEVSQAQKVHVQRP